MHAGEIQRARELHRRHDRVLGEAFAPLGIQIADTIRIADHNVLPASARTRARETLAGDSRQDDLAHDILVFGTPIGWDKSLPSPSASWSGWTRSFPNRRGWADAELFQVAVAAIVGNERRRALGLFAAVPEPQRHRLDDPRFAACYWVGEAMSDVNFIDLEHRPRKVSATAKMVAGNAAHLAQLLKDKPYPGIA